MNNLTFTCEESGSSTICTSDYMPISYYDWVFVSTVSITLLAFVPLGLFFNLLKR